MKIKQNAKDMKFTKETITEELVQLFIAFAENEISAEELAKEMNISTEKVEKVAKEFNFFEEYDNLPQDGEISPEEQDEIMCETFSQFANLLTK